MTASDSRQSKHRFTFSERWAIYEAYDHLCIYCREIVAFRDLWVDHIILESLLNDGPRLAALVEDYGLGSGFAVNSFENWACAHRHCNQAKGDTTFDKSRALHYLLIAERKAKLAASIKESFERASGINRALARLRALIESGALAAGDVVTFVESVLKNAEIGLNNPVVVTFGLRMEDVYNALPEGAPGDAPAIYDWLENELTKQLVSDLQCPIEMREDQRNGETVSVRYAIWDLDFSRLDAIDVGLWEILELELHTDLYGAFLPRDSR